MRRSLTAILVVALVSLTSRDAAAQSVKDVSAFAGLSGTPVGALTPVMVSPTGANAFSAQYSHFSPSCPSGFTCDGDNSLGATFYRKAGAKAVVAGTLGYTQVGCPTGATCDNLIMLGGDVHSKMWDNGATGTNAAMSANFQGSLGYGKAGDFSMLSAAVSVPLAISMEQASKARISGFVRPGYGWGRLSASGASGSGSESGTLPFIGLGGAWMSPAGWAIHASFNKIIMDNGGNSFGLGFSWNMK